MFPSAGPKLSLTQSAANLHKLAADALRTSFQCIVQLNPRQFGATELLLGPTEQINAWCYEDGYLTFVGRDDDVITSAGYRIGPSEIEHTLLKHPAVALSAVVGIPDPIRTEAIKAWIVLRPGFAPSEQLAREIQDFVKVQLAAHEYPRFVQFADTLPMTATGKVLRRELRGLG